MSDAEWVFVEPLIRRARMRNGRQGADHRRMLDGVSWIARTDSLWRDRLEEFGKWSSVYRKFRSGGSHRVAMRSRPMANGLPMRTDVTPGQMSDHRGFDFVIGDDLPAPDTLVAARARMQTASVSGRRPAVRSPSPRCAATERPARAEPPTRSAT